MAEHEHPVDRIIDEAARLMMVDEPSSRFSADVMARIGTDERSSTVVSRFAGWHVATAGALALLLMVVVTLSRQSVQQPIPADRSAAGSQGVVPEQQQVESSSSAARASADRASGLTSSFLEPLPEIAPINEDPIVVEALVVTPIEMVEIELARLELAPLPIERLEIINRRETP